MNILIVRVSAIGDVIHTIPALLLLKQLAPDAKISWLVQEKAASLLLGQPFIDQLFLLPDNFLWPSNLGKTKKIIETLRQTRWDAIIDFQGLEKTSLIFATLSGKKYGFTACHARSKLSTLFTHKRSEPVYTNIIQKNLDLASFVATDLFGARTCPVVDSLNGRNVLAVSAQDQVAVDTWLQRNHVSRFMLLAPNTTWDSKHWPLEHWLSLIKTLVADQAFVAAGISIVLVGSNFNEMAAALAMLIKEENLPVLLLPTFHLLAMAHLMKKSALIIAPDTGLVHLADLVGERSIALFGPTDAKRHGPFLMQENRDNVVQISCSHHYQKTHGENKTGVNCMYQLTPVELYMRVMEILGF